MKTHFILIFVLLQGINMFGQSFTFHSVNAGSWADSSTWDQKTTPRPIDSVYVHHFLSFDFDLYFDSGAFLKIDSGAGICGAGFNLKSFCGAWIENYGLINGDSLEFTDGFNKGWMGALLFFRVSACIEDWTSRCNIVVGQSLDCKANPCPVTSSGIKFKNGVTIYPNPAKDQISIYLSFGRFTTGLKKYEFELFDLYGHRVGGPWILYRGDNHLDLPELPGGCYAYRIKEKWAYKPLIHIGKIVILN